MKIKIRSDLPGRLIPLIRQTLIYFQNHFEVEFDWWEQADLLVGRGASSDIRLSEKFINAFLQSRFDHRNIMEKEPLIRCDDGTPDWLGTCVYMAHFFQEYTCDPHSFDDLDRFRYESSYQYRFQNVTENLVLKYFIQLKESCSKLSALKRKPVPSKIWITHDIDELYHNNWPELKTAIRTLNLGAMLRLIFTWFLRDPDAEIFRRIMQINQEHEVKATFFWLANRQNFRTKSGRTITNGNYDMSDPKIRGYLNEIKGKGHELAVHQSLGCRDLRSEMECIDVQVQKNRNHYLHGRLSQLFQNLQKSGIRIDSTAGFSRLMGFRNSYGMPVVPYDLDNHRFYDLVEMPLHIMDASFLNSGKSPEKTLQEILQFLDRNKTDNILTLLWHNSYFSEIKFKIWVRIYQEILEFCQSHNLQFAVPEN